MTMSQSVKMPDCIIISMPASALLLVRIVLDWPKQRQVNALQVLIVLVNVIALHLSLSGIIIQFSLLKCNLAGLLGKE